MSKIENNISLIAKLAIPVFILLSIGTLVISVWTGRREVALINPEIYPAFARIQLKAMLYFEQNFVKTEEYERYKAVKDRMEKYPYPDSDISAEEYYKFLSRLGFQLPPFKLKKPATDEERNRCQLESDKLIELQNKILEGQLKKKIREIEEMIKPEKIE